MRQTILNFPIITKKFAQHNELKPLLLDAIDKTEQYENLTGPNNNITKCDWESGRFDSEREWFKIIKDPLYKHLQSWTNNLGYHDFVIHEIWFQQYATNSQHNWHVHGANFTNVYYLDLPNGSPNTQWVNPITKQVRDFDVSEGDIITFPSWLIHKAPKNYSDNMKTIISWNMDITLTDYYGD
jgi:hypothetical protein